MANDNSGFLNFQSWSSKTWISAVVAGLVALLLFIMLHAGFLLALIVGIIVFLVVAWLIQRDAAIEPPAVKVSRPPAAAPARPTPAASPAARPVPAASPAPVAPPPSPTPAAKAAEAVPAAQPATQVAPAAPAARPAAASGAAERPTALAAPRPGGADDLKRIKGVGPKLEEVLHGLGYFHFDQIAAWTEKEIAWVDSNLEGFRGRASRDDWVGQSKILATGGETEHSKRVDRGEST